MSKLLHIQASPMEGRSYSNRVAQKFIDAYRAVNPLNSVEILDIWKDSLPDFDLTAASGKYKVMSGQPHSVEEAAAWQEVVSTIEQFKSADHVLVSAPMWNFGIPYRLKQYIDVLVQPGLTFSYDPEQGYSGLVTGRPVQFILSRAGEYSAESGLESLDHQRSYLEQVFGFIGFTDIRTLTIEPTMAGGPEVADRKLAEALLDAREAGRELGEVASRCAMAA